MWKKISVIFGTSALALTLAACGQTGEQNTKETVAPAGEIQSQDTAATDTKSIESSEKMSEQRDVAQFLESYEAYIDEYLAFSERYKASGNIMAMAQEAIDMQKKASELAIEAEELKDEQLSAEELAMYTEVMSRCTEKAATAAQNISEATLGNAG